MNRGCWKQGGMAWQVMFSIQRFWSCCPRDVVVIAWHLRSLRLGWLGTGNFTCSCFKVSIECETKVLFLKDKTVLSSDEFIL